MHADIFRAVLNFFYIYLQIHSYHESRATLVLEANLSSSYSGTGHDVTDLVMVKLHYY